MTERHGVGVRGGVALTEDESILRLGQGRISVGVDRYGFFRDDTDTDFYDKGR